MSFWSGFILLLNQLAFVFPFSNKWFTFKKLWVALTVNVFLQKISSIYFITWKLWWIAYIVAILKFSLIPHSYLNFKFYCFFLYHISKLWLFLSLSTTDFLQWVFVISYFDHCSLHLYSQSSSASLSLRNCFTSRLGKVRFIYSLSSLLLNSRKCSKTF